MQRCVQREGQRFFKNCLKIFEIVLKFFPIFVLIFLIVVSYFDGKIDSIISMPFSLKFRSLKKTCYGWTDRHTDRRTNGQTVDASKKVCINFLMYMLLIYNAFLLFPIKFDCLCNIFLQYCTFLFLFRCFSG